MSDWTTLLARFSPFQCIFARDTESVNLGEGRGYEPPYNLEYVVILYSNEKFWLRGITGLIYHQFDGTRLSGDAIFSYILPTLCRSYQRPRVNKDSSTTVSSYTDNNCGSLLIPTLILLCLWKASICYSAPENRTRKLKNWHSHSRSILGCTWLTRVSAFGCHDVSIWYLTTKC